jgi:enoyl-CoA hydratase
MLLAADTRIGADGAFKIGLNEVAIGLRLPIFAVELARDRLSKRHFVAATVQGQIYDPSTARDVGFLDRVVAAETVVETALEEARRLAELPAGALARTKELARRDTVARIRETLAKDMAELGPPSNAKRP